jgi:hypothetical protein
LFDKTKVACCDAFLLSCARLPVYGAARDTIGGCKHGVPRRLDRAPDLAGLGRREPDWKLRRGGPDRPGGGVWRVAVVCTTHRAGIARSGAQASKDAADQG